MKRNLFTSEHVSPGHPDKICDQISDSILDYHYSKSPSVKTRVACETLVKDNTVVLAGEVTSQDTVITYRPIVSEVLDDLGYTSKVSPKFCSSNYILKQLISGQSPDISACVDRQEIGAGDQGIMFGYAVCEAPDYTGWCHYIARNLVSELWRIKHEDDLISQTCLCPDYKVQVTIDYTEHGPVLDTILASLSHTTDVTDSEEFRRTIENRIRDIISNLAEEQQWAVNIDDYKVLVNPYGPFTVFGPIADSGLTGRKIVCDQYGGYAPVGGGAFSGKDLTKVDRTAAYMARFIAKNFLRKYRKIQDTANAVAPYDCSVEVAYIIGQAEPVSINVCVEYNNGNKKTIDPDYVMEVIFGNNIKTQGDNLYELFKPENIIYNLNLFNVDFSEVSKFGHMGTDTSNTNKPWELII